jgi:hypothetical protein
MGHMGHAWDIYENGTVPENENRTVLGAGIGRIGR